MGAVGYHSVRSPCLCFYFVSWSWWSLRGRGIISDSCQPSALFGIMFLLGVILRLQKSCCLYSEKQRGDWRWVAGFAPADLKKAKKKVSVTLAWTHMFAENWRISNDKTGGSYCHNFCRNHIFHFIKYLQWNQMTCTLGFVLIFNAAMKIWNSNLF